jgi:hypothetical protein
MQGQKTKETDYETESFKRSKTKEREKGSFLAKEGKSIKNSAGYMENIYPASPSTISLPPSLVPILNRTCFAFLSFIV